MTRLGGRARLQVARLTRFAERDGRPSATPWIVLGLWFLAFAFCLAVSWAAQS